MKYKNILKIFYIISYLIVIIFYNIKNKYSYIDFFKFSEMIFKLHDFFNAFFILLHIIYYIKTI